MLKCLPTFLVILLLAPPTTARELFTPDPSIEPARVVEIQLQALQQNDTPMPDFGIAQTWIFAHPRNKRATGPIERFAAMIKGPNYEMMINHREHSIEPVVLTETYAVFNVLIITRSANWASFSWEVSKVQSGPLDKSWMTTSVSPPMQVKDTI